MHAFLFADLRGYTDFAARRGDRAAAELLARFRTLVRTEIERHQGAEIRTEGDSFYVVFPSVSSATMCAIAIAGTARDASVTDPALPMAVGIGVHFGETVDTAEGSVGSAVNLAARLASAAGPNEVLVSDVVRSLLRGTAEVRAVPAGTRRLKGFREPVSVFRALPSDGAAVPPRKRGLRAPVFVTARTLAIVAAVAIAVVGLAAVGLAVVLNPRSAGSTTSPGPPSASTSPTAVATARPFSDGVMQPGDYVARQFEPNVSLQLADDWCGGFRHNQFQTTVRTGRDGLYLWTPGAAGAAIAPIAGDPCVGRQTAADAGYLALNKVEQLYADTGCEDGTTRSFDRSWDTLVAYLTSRPGTTVTNRASATLGGAVGVGFDLHVDRGIVCPASGAPVRAVLAFPMTVLDSTGLSRVAVVWWGEGQYLHVWVVDVDGRLVVATLGHEGSSEPLDRGFLDKAYRVIPTLRFLPTS